MDDRVVEQRINRIPLFSAPELGNLVVDCGGVCHLCVRGNTLTKKRLQYLLHKYHSVIRSSASCVIQVL